MKMVEKIKLPLFDDASVALLNERAALPSALSDALHRFIGLTPADRSAITPHVYAYYRDLHTHADSAWIDAVMAVPTQPDDIWKHVRPLSITLTSRLAQFETIDKDDPVPYVLLEANCDWEDEHGLQLVWREGHALVKVSECDGKPLQAENVQSSIIYHSTYDNSFSTH